MKKSKGRIVFEVINVIVLSLLSFACLFPLLNILAMSFSSSTAVAAGKVSIFPVEFNLYAYDYVVGKADFWKSLLRSVERVAIGLPLNMILTIMLAYPLSKESTSFRMRTVYVWIFFFTMLFSGGLIPGYLLIQNLKMMDTIWALVLPAAVPVYNVILMLNFFRLNVLVQRIDCLYIRFFNSNDCFRSPYRFLDHMECFHNFICMFFQ